MKNKNLCLLFSLIYMYIKMVKLKAENANIFFFVLNKFCLDKWTWTILPVHGPVVHSYISTSVFCFFLIQQWFVAILMMWIQCLERNQARYASSLWDGLRVNTNFEVQSHLLLILIAMISKPYLKLEFVYSCFPKTPDTCLEIKLVWNNRNWNEGA